MTTPTDTPRTDALPTWKCTICGCIKHKEEEVICWNCGKGEMIYQRPTTDTPLDACPHCGAEQKFPFSEENAGIHFRKFSCGFMADAGIFHRPALCHEREARQKAESEVERLTEQLESTKQIAVKFWNVLEENGFKMELPQ